MAWYNKLHWRIICGLVLGIVYGVVAAALGWGEFTSDWISPFGTVFLNALKLIGVPLVLGSLITGVASLSDIRKLSRIGGRTIAIYVTTTRWRSPSASSPSTWCAPGTGFRTR